jgi:hypothetical protein
MKVFLSKEQYKQLLEKGSIIVGETTIVYNEEDDYITPIEEIDTSKFVKTAEAYQQNVVYVRNHKEDTTIGYTSSVVAYTFPVRNVDGNLPLPAPAYITQPHYAASVGYCDLVYSPKLYLHKINIYDNTLTGLSINFNIISGTPFQYLTTEALGAAIASGPNYTIYSSNDYAANPSVATRFWLNSAGTITDTQTYNEWTSSNLSIIDTVSEIV